LLRIGQLVRSQSGGAASFLSVITADGFARRRPAGIYTIPITCLGA